MKKFFLQKFILILIFLTIIQQPNISIIDANFFLDFFPKIFLKIAQYEWKNANNTTFYSSLQFSNRIFSCCSQKNLWKQAEINFRILLWILMTKLWFFWKLLPCVISSIIHIFCWTEKKIKLFWRFCYI